MTELRTAEQIVLAKASMALETTECIPKTVYTAREALVRTRKALQAVVDYFETENNK